MPDENSPWATKDVVYISIVGVIMLAALFEWILWLAAFLYGLCKVYQKAEDTGTKVLSVVMMIAFTILRAAFLPVMLATLPLPANMSRYLSQSTVSFFQWFAFWTFSAVLTIPWLFCVYQLVSHSLGRTPLIKHILDEIAAPKIVIVMPCYKEVPEILLRTINSIVDCDYPSACLHIFLSFDGDLEDELYLKTIAKLGVPLVRHSGFPTSIDVIYKETRVTISRFAHGGKRHCQKRTFRLIEKVYQEYLKINDNLFVLFIDSDCILDKVCIQNFMYEMELKPGSKRDKLAMTGIVTATTESNSLITLLQDMEYIHGQLFERSVESCCGAVTCLPGALTILRFSAFRKLAKQYFADKAEQCDDLFDYGKCHLGEDRWLTHLFMIAARYGQIGMSTSAFCKTEAVQTFRSLLKQRRRWFLGFMTNEVCMLTDKRLWIRYPLLCTVRLAQNTIRTTALLFFILVVSLCTTAQRVEDLPIGFIIVSLGLNWVLMIYFATLLGRYKIMLYPLLFLIGPFLNWAFVVYGIFTAGQRTWGGPRADAGQADSITSPQAAIEHAEATGDDLNVVPETFRPGTEARKLATSPDASIQRIVSLVEPLRRSEAKSRHDIAHVLAENLSSRASRQSSIRIPHVPLQPRASLDFNTTGSSSQKSVGLPKSAESFVDHEGRASDRRGLRVPVTNAQFGADRYIGGTTSNSSSTSNSCHASYMTTSSGESIDVGVTKTQRLPTEAFGHEQGIPLVNINQSHRLENAQE